MRASQRGAVGLIWTLLACSERDPAVETEASTDSTSTSTSTSDSTGDGDGDADMLPNLDVLATADLVRDSIWTTTEFFDGNHCAVEEGCVEQIGPRRLLRFSTYAPNVGAADFIVGSPQLDPESFEWAVCHQHWHFSGFADYRLLDARGLTIASGHKPAFALMDLAPWIVDAGPSTYPLEDGTQGISAGWADAYVSQLDCQWVDITGVPAGDYQLEITINPDARVEESNHADNTLRVDVTLTDVDTGPPGPPDDWSCPLPSYGADNICDCGCGAFDPDCANPTIDACEQCNQVGSCAADQMDCSSIAPNNNAICQ